MKNVEEFIVTQEWLETLEDCVNNDIQTFKKHFPNGGKVSEVLKLCEDFDYGSLGVLLVKNLPFNKKPLVRDYVNGHLFYNGNVHITGNVVSQKQKRIIVKGNLKINGKLDLRNWALVDANRVKANEIYLDNYASIYVRTKLKANIVVINFYSFIRGHSVIKSLNILYHGQIHAANIKANIVNMTSYANIFGNIKADIFTITSGYVHKNVKANIINLYGGQVIGNVDANEIINSDGVIWGNVNTIKIKIINYDSVKGEITYKCSNERKKAST
ncbi:hypothetical protein [Snodgrassella sp. ESL0324]|uniref:hypothetical protein n=1 Tax=Snodgrassella sp. ESL0324 TaxID=2705033 RepID=UPI001581ABDC|nr:hypothetical protein [Snodgrassella sp. ESL0324]NUF08923.1 hypothetical protein [Snodgrassella sp. ESL0324]